MLSPVSIKDDALVFVVFARVFMLFLGVVMPGEPGACFRMRWP
jgi:hypothetical protein